MTKEEQHRIVLGYDSIFKNIINKNISKHKFKEDILQDFYLRILKTANLPKEEIEILKYCKTVLKNLMIDSLKYKKYKLITDTNESLGIERDEDDIVIYDIQSNPENIQDLNDFNKCEQFFIDVLDDCLLESYNNMGTFDKVLLVEHLLLGYTAKDLGKKYNILMQTVKNVVRKFRQSCNININ